LNRGGKRKQEVVSYGGRTRVTRNEDVLGVKKREKQKKKVGVWEKKGGGTPQQQRRGANERKSCGVGAKKKDHLKPTGRKRGKLLLAEEIRRLVRGWDSDPGTWVGGKKKNGRWKKKS